MAAAPKAAILGSKATAKPSSGFVEFTNKSTTEHCFTLRAWRSSNIGTIYPTNKTWRWAFINHLFNPITTKTPLSAITTDTTYQHVLRRWMRNKRKILWLNWWRRAICFSICPIFSNRAPISNPTNPWWRRKYSNLMTPWWRDLLCKSAIVAWLVLSKNSIPTLSTNLKSMYTSAIK